MHNKVSVLSEISIYTTDAQGATPLADVMKRIHEEFDGDKIDSWDRLNDIVRKVMPQIGC